MFAQPLYLAGRAVGHAGALIIGQVEVGGTGTLVASSRGEKAEVTAATIVCLARVVGHWERGRKRGNVLISDIVRTGAISGRQNILSPLYLNTKNELLHVTVDCFKHLS